VLEATTEMHLWEQTATVNHVPVQIKGHVSNYKMRPLSAWNVLRGMLVHNVNSVEMDTSEIPLAKLDQLQSVKLVIVMKILILMQLEIATELLERVLNVFTILMETGTILFFCFSYYKLHLCIFSIANSCISIPGARDVLLDFTEMRLLFLRVTANRAIAIS